MKTEFLKGFGLSDEDIQKILAENGKDIEREKAKTSEALEKNKALTDDISKLKNDIAELEESNASAEDYKKKFEELQQKIEAEEAAAKEAAEDKALTKAIEATFGEKKFTSDYVRNGIIADMKAEIAKPENKGKGYSELFESLTKDKEGIFANPNPPVPMKGMGDFETGSSELDDLSMAEYISARKQMKG